MHEEQAGVTGAEQASSWASLPLKDGVRGKNLGTGALLVSHPPEHPGSLTAAFQAWLVETELYQTPPPRASAVPACSPLPLPFILLCAYDQHRALEHSSPQRVLPTRGLAGPRCLLSVTCMTHASARLKI